MAIPSPPAILSAKTTYKHHNMNRSVKALVLLNEAATSIFISQSFINKYQITTNKSSEPIPAYMANKPTSHITHQADLNISIQLYNDDISVLVFTNSNNGTRQ